MNPPGVLPFAPVVLLYKMAYRNGGVSPARIPLLLIYTLRYIIFEPLRLAEIIIYHRKIKAHQIDQPPVFILGHWRSGTSFLQGLVCRDNRMASNTIFGSLFPECLYLTEAWLKPVLNFICRTFKIQYSIQRVPMDLGLPAETDMTLCSLCSEESYTWGQLFPKRFDDWIDKTVLRNNETWIRDYDYFIRKLSLKHRGKRIVVKSPGDTGRVDMLLRQYPKALFIYIQRDAEAVFSSNVYFWRVLQREVSLQQIPEDRINEMIRANYERIVSRYMEQKHLIPTNQIAEIQFDELVKDPEGQLKIAYQKLGLGEVHHHFAIGS